MNTQLDIIKNASILKQEDINFLTKISNELLDTITKCQIFRTETEIEISVLNDVKYPTKASKYWQAVREQSVMFENLVTTSFEYRRNEVKIKRLLKQINEMINEFDKEEAQVDLDECLFKRVNMELTAHDRVRELRIWSMIKTKLDDGTFDSKDVNSHQLISYTQRFILQACNSPDNMSVAESNNLRGQLVTALKEVETRGLLPMVLKDLPDSIVKQVLGSLNFEKVQDKNILGKKI